MAGGGHQQHLKRAGMISVRELMDQIDTNKRHFIRSSRSVPEFPATVASGSPLAPSVPTYLSPVRELDNDPDTFMFLCIPFPVITLYGFRRRTCSWISNLLWTRPPLPCVTTTCGPVHHVRSCEFHPLSGALPYKMPIRRSTSLPSVRVQRWMSFTGNLSSSTSFSATSSTTQSSSTSSLAGS